jgi:uncharacterized phage infection (PIP) family protein YhgE
MAWKTIKLMPVITPDMLKELADIELKIAGEYKNIGKKIKDLSESESKLADGYNSYSKDLRGLHRVMRDRLSKMEDIKRAEAAGIEEDSIDDIKKQIDQIDAMVKKIEIYYDALKELGENKKRIIMNMNAYSDALVATAKIRKDIVGIDIKIEKEQKNDYAVESMSKLEEKRKDLEREYERSRRDVAKKLEILNDEKKEIANLWKKYKDSVQEII